MSKFYSGGINQDENQDIQNQTDSMFYKSNNGINEQMKIMEEKYEKKINKYHDKIKASPPPQRQRKRKRKRKRIK